jgi:hypothetical protein
LGDDPKAPTSPVLAVTRSDIRCLVELSGLGCLM